MRCKITKEEVNIDIDKGNFKYLTTLNVIKKEENFHFVNIFMVATATDEQIAKLVNHDTHACKEWEWIPLDEFIKRDDLYHSLYELFKQGLHSLDLI